MPQTMSHPSRPLVRTTLCILVLVFGCQATLSVRTASAAGSGSEAIQGLGSYFLTLPYSGIEMAVAELGAVAGGIGFIFTGGDKATADKIWGRAIGGEYVVTPQHLRGEKDLHFFGTSRLNSALDKDRPDIGRPSAPETRHSPSSRMPHQVRACDGGAFHQGWWIPTTGWCSFPDKYR